MGYKVHTKTGLSSNLNLSYMRLPVGWKLFDDNVAISYHDKLPCQMVDFNRLKHVVAAKTYKFGSAIATLEAGINGDGFIVKAEAADPGDLEILLDELRKMLGGTVIELRPIRSRWERFVACVRPHITRFLAEIK